MESDRPKTSQQHHPIGDSFQNLTHKVSSFLSRKHPSPSPTTTSTPETFSENTSSGLRSRSKSHLERKSSGLSVLTNIKAKVISPIPSPRGSSLKKNPKNPNSDSKGNTRHSRSSSAAPLLSTFNASPDFNGKADGVEASSSSYSHKLNVKNILDQENGSNGDRILMRRRMSDGSVRRRASVGTQEIPTSSNSSSSLCRAQSQRREIRQSSSISPPDLFTTNATNSIRVDSTKRATSSNLAQRRQPSMSIHMMPSRSRSNSGSNGLQLQSPRTPPTSGIITPPVQKMSKGNPVAEIDMKKPFWSLRSEEYRRVRHQRSRSEISPTERSETESTEEQNLEEVRQDVSSGKEARSTSKSVAGLGLGIPTSNSSTTSEQGLKNFSEHKEESKTSNPIPFKGSPTKWSPSLLTINQFNPNPTLRRATTEETLKPDPKVSAAEDATGFVAKGDFRRAQSSSSLAAESSSRSSSSSPTPPTLSEFRTDGLSTPFSIKTLWKRLSLDSGPKSGSLTDQLRKMKSTPSNPKADSTSLPASPTSFRLIQIRSRGAEEGEGSEVELGFQKTCDDFLSQYGETRRASAGDIFQSNSRRIKPTRKGILRSSASLSSLDHEDDPNCSTLNISKDDTRTIPGPFPARSLKKKCSFESGLLQVSLADPISREVLMGMRPIDAERNRESQSVPSCPNNSPTDAEFPHSSSSKDAQKEDQPKQDVIPSSLSSTPEENVLVNSASDLELGKVKGFSQSRSNGKALQLETPRRNSALTTPRPCTPPGISTPRSPVSKSPNLSGSFSTPETSMTSSSFSPCSSDDSWMTLPRSPKWRVDTYEGGHDNDSPLSSPTRLTSGIKEETEDEQDLNRDQGCSLSASVSLSSSTSDGDPISDSAAKRGHKIGSSPPSRRLTLGSLQSVGEEQE